MRSALRALRRVVSHLANTIDPEYGRVPGIHENRELYHPIYPIASYAPWNQDQDFLKTFLAIKPNTLVDIYRCWELWDLIGQSSKLNGSFIEIGVWRGGTAALMAQRARLCGITDPFYLCDTFRGVVKTSEHDTLYKGGEHADTSRKQVEDLFATLGLHPPRIVEGIFPDESSSQVDSTTFRFCHIDVDAYQSAKDIVLWIWPRMVSGGIIVYDDYGFLGCEGIARFVNEQIPESDRLVFRNLNGHAIVVKVPHGTVA